MGVTKRDQSGVFDAEVHTKSTRRSATLDQIYRISAKGITFVTQQFLPEWTEVGVEMRLPVAGTKKDHAVGCRGVVVQCTRCQQGKGFEIALLFLDLPKRVQTQLSATPSAFGPACISISR